MTESSYPLEAPSSLPPAGDLASLLERDWVLPSPSARLERVAFDGASYWMVRDDLLHPVAGGNKLRKLDGILPRLVAEGVSDVVTCGGAQSSHTTATACCCAERGMRAHSMLRGERPALLTGYTLLTHLYGEVRYVDRATYRTRPAFMESYAVELRAKGRKVAVIPEGGRCPEAMLGLVRLVDALVVAMEERGLDPMASWTLVVDSGTGTSAVGVAAGIALLGLPWRVDAVELIASARSMYEGALAALCEGWSALFGQLPSPLPLRWLPRRAPRRFGKLVPEEIARSRAFAAATGILVDPIFTLAAVDHVLAASSEERARMIQIHTGGTLNLMGVAQRASDAFD